jgi:hypothetical protein
MSDGPFPTTWKELKPYVTWGSLIFTCGLVFIERVIGGHWGEALAALLLGMGIAAVALHAKTWIERTNPNLAFVGFSLAVLALIAMPFIEERRWPYAPKPLAFSDIALPAEGPDIKRDFNAEYNEHSAELGKQIQAIIPGSNAYQAWHERALVIWIQHPKPLFCVVSVDSAHKSFCEDEKDTNYPLIYFSNSQEFLARFKDLPADKMPPFAGVAHRWLQDPAKWSWIGYVDQECSFVGASYYWKLSTGRIVGVFRRKRNQASGQILAIAENGEASARSTIDAPECIESRPEKKK